jgi:prepilin-type N-terminal cleavage/methylation domain-containing protein
MKRQSPNGFTLIEMVVVIAVLLVLAALTIGVVGFVIRKSSLTKALNEIHSMEGWCEAYKNDHGVYPQNADTDALDPRVHADPGSSIYQKASLHLYSCITGDFLPDGAPDGKPEGESRTYGTFFPKQLSMAAGSAGTVRFIQDPFGGAYGYSTAGNQIEAAYRAALSRNPTAPRPAGPRGYNPTFDLWSTADGKTLSLQPKWQKNWPD